MRPGSADSLAEYWALKDGRYFVADSPVSVLGLFALWEDYGDRWRYTTVDDEYDRVWSWSVTNDNYASMTDDEFDMLKKEARLHLATMDIHVPQSITREELTRIMNSYHKEPDVE